MASFGSKTKIAVFLLVVQVGTHLPRQTNTALRKIGHGTKSRAAALLITLTRNPLSATTIGSGGSLNFAAKSINLNLPIIIGSVRRWSGITPNSALWVLSHAPLPVSTALQPISSASTLPTNSNRAVDVHPSTKGRIAPLSKARGTSGANLVVVQYTHAHQASTVLVMAIPATQSNSRYTSDILLFGKSGYIHYDD